MSADNIVINQKTDMVINCPIVSNAMHNGNEEANISNNNEIDFNSKNMDIENRHSENEPIKSGADKVYQGHQNIELSLGKNN